MATPGDSKHLSLIDSGISNLWSLSLPGFLESLNLHGNHIQHITNLSHVTKLVHLDLSANQISDIDGLEKLEHLKTLNLSCNVITKIEGVSSLRSLQRLDLSYNQVTDLGGLAGLGSRSCRLQHLALQGNKLRNLPQIANSLQGLGSLKHLVLQQDGSGNPVCSQHGYVSELFFRLPHMETINDLDSTGKLNSIVDTVAHIPGLEAYLDFLLSNDTEQADQPSLDSPTAQSILTPTIDAVMEQFRQRASMDLSSSLTQSASSPTSDGRHTDNMRKILLDNQFSSQSTKQVKPKGRVVWASSGEESEPVKDSHTDKTHSQTYSQTHTQRKALKAEARLSPKAGSSSGRAKVLNRRARPGKDANNSATNKNNEGYDEKGREDAEMVYKDLMSTLETERERRWKAEQATRRVVNVLKDMQAKGEATESMKMSAIEATSQLKTALLTEHEANIALRGDVSRLRDEKCAVEQELEAARKGEGRGKDALKATEHTMAAREAEGLADRAHQTKRLQEAQQRASAMTREVEVLRHSQEVTRDKVHNLQETLAVREQHHREELKQSYRLDSPDLQKIIDEKVKAVERSHQAELVKQQEKVEQLSKQYSELEDEFRYALHTEESRFQQMRHQLEGASTDLSEHKHLLVAAHRKDESNTAMVAELTHLVKEQKGRISELSKSKQEQVAALKGKVKELEESLEDSRSGNSQIESMRQAKARAQATVQAQESVIEGLKAERKLWGQELAQQGASLSQDRGRLDAKIEAQAQEMRGLKKQLERETDAVRIKAKMVEDQTESIRKLKDAVVERDEALKVTRSESLTTHRSLEDQYAETKTALDDTRELLDRTSSRKEELKVQVKVLEEELGETREVHAGLSARWKDKSELIGRLEQQVTVMKNTWTQKEMRLQAERDAALDQAKQAVQKLQGADSSFRHQLEVKEAGLQEALTLVEQGKAEEVALAHSKVEMVEEEMRQMLRETEVNKRAMEAKVKRLTVAMGDLQTDLM